MKNILICIDFKDQTESFVQKAIDTLQGVEAEYKLIHVAAPDPDFVGYQVGPQYIRDFRAHELRDEHKKLQKLANLLIDQKLVAEGLLIQGPTIESILEEVKKLSGDLLVIGSHEHGFLYHSFFGTITYGVLHKTTIPTLVIPINE